MASFINGDLQYGVATLSGETDLSVQSITANDITTTNLTATNITDTTMDITPTGSNTVLGQSLPSQYIRLYDNALLLRNDYWHYVKYVLSNSNAISGNVDGPWLQGYNGGVLASGTASYAKQVHFQWRSGRNYSLVPFDCNDTLTTKLGITATDTQTISFGSNAPTMSGANIANQTIPDSALSSNVDLLNVPQSITADKSFYSDLFLTKGLIQCGQDYYQVKIGYQSQASANIPLGDNVSIGNSSLRSINNVNAIRNTAIGSNAGRNLINGVGNLFLGANSGYAVVTGQDNLVVGSSMGAATGTGNNISNNVAIGGNCLQFVADSCAANLAIGPYALYNDGGSGFGGIYNTAIGPNAGVRAGTNSNYNCFLGGCASQPSNITPLFSNYNYVTTIGVDAVASGSNQIVLGTSNETTYIPGNLNVSGNSTFNTKLTLINSSGNIIVGQNNSNSGSNAVLLGNGAGANLASGADSITAIGTNALYSLQGNGFENMAIGNSSMYYLTYGNYNSCFGKQVGNAMTYGCFENTFTGHNCATSNYTKPITYILYTGATTTNTSSLTMTAVPTGLYAGCYVNTYYNGIRYEAPLTSFNPTTFVLTLGNNVNITTNKYIYFYERTYTTATYTTGVALSGINFTISTGLTISAGNTMAYRSSATLATTIGVVSYNSGTGALSVSSNITVVASTTMYFMNTTTQYGSYINNNSIIGSQSLARITTGASGNTCIGQNVMSANDATTPKYYVGGSNNTAVGINAGSLNIFKSNNNTYIGANADILSGTDNNNITHATAIGADAKVFQSNTVMLGSSSDTVHIPNQINIRTQFLPFAVSNITGGSMNLTAPFYGTYVINTTTTPITLSLPTTFPSNCVGIKLTFRRIGTTANVVNINYVSGTNFIYIRGAGTSVTGTATTTLLPSTSVYASITCISSNSWSIDI